MNTSNKSSITLKQLFNDLNFLKPITNYNENTEILDSEISRPGLELTGFTKHFRKNRIQVIGGQEFSYLKSIDCDLEELSNFFELDFPLLVFSKEHLPGAKFLEICEQKNIAVCSSTHKSSKLQTLLYSYLEYQLAPETQVHGVLLSVFGMGVLIKGVSGIGKSELALELINKGHFLVADDAVVLRQTDDVTLIGSAPKLLKNRIEIRGVGIVDIQKLYGVTKVVDTKRVDLVIEIQEMTGKEDRIGTAVKTYNVLDVEIPMMEIPISIGRSISSLIEVAVANFDLKNNYGYDSAEMFVSDLNSLLTKENNE